MAVFGSIKCQRWDSTIDLKQRQDFKIDTSAYEKISVEQKLWKEQKMKAKILIIYGLP